MEKVTSSEICAALRKHFQAPAYRVFFEVGNDTGARVRRHADAVAIGIWPSTGHLIHGLEVKVSRSDFLSEMKNPEKSQPVYKHCHRWSLVAPAGMIESKELPPTWGLITYKDGSFRNAVKPQALDPEEISPGFMAALVRRAGEADEKLISDAIALARKSWDAEFDSRLKRQIESIENARGNEKKSASRILDELQELRDLLGSDLNEYSAKGFAEAVKFVRRAGIVGTNSNVKGVLNSLKHASQSIERAMEKLDSGNGESA